MPTPVARRRLTTLVSVFIASTTVALSASAALGASRTWDGGGLANLNYNWANTANWTTGVAPIANDSLVFTGNKGRNGNTNNIAAGTQFNGITFNSGAASFSLDGNAITLGGTVTNNSTNAQTITLNLALAGGPRTFNAASGNLAVSGSVSGTAGLVKSGSGSLTLSGANTYSGGTTLDSGTLVMGNANALGSGTVATTGGSVVEWSGNDSIANVFTLGSGTTSFGTGGLSTLAGSIGGTGSLRKFDVGTLALAGDNTYTGATSVAAGTLAIGSGGTTGSVAGDIVNNSAVTFNRSDSLTYSGSISGNGSVNKRGGGTLTLAGNNTFSGGITLWGGTLALGSSGAVGNSGTISFGGGTLQFSASNTTDYSARFSTAASQQAAIDTNGQSVTLATPLTSAGGSLTKSGGGTLTLAGDNTYTGLTTVSAGTLAIGSGGTTGWVAGNIVNNAAVTFNRSDNVNYSGLISGTGTLTKMGSGVLKLTGTTSGADKIVLDFATNVSAGGLQAVSADVTGTADLRIGNSGTGTLNVTGGSVINRAGSLGFNAGGVGTATVSSGTWGNSFDLNVGYAGTGTLDVTGGSVFNAVSTLGAQIGGVGTATVSSGTWANSSILFAGLYGTGTLNVTGGSLTNSIGYLGHGGIGAATVSSGTWANRDSLTVGFSGTGTLNVTGGSVTNLDGFLASAHANSVGTATISGGTWASNGDLYVGNRGGGTLNVTGGSVTNSRGNLGFYATGVGTANVSSGTWANSAALLIGVSGTGTLNVTGGSVTSSFGYMGQDAGAVGTVTVSSGTWANSGNLTVGMSGTGTLTMNGGLVSVSGTLSKGTSGTIDLNSGGTLQIGIGSTGGVLLGGTGSLVNNGTLVFNRSNASTYSGVLSGSGAVTKLGGGVLTLTGANTYSGGTTVSAGELVGTTNSLQGDIVNNGSLRFDQLTSGTYAGTVTGNGSLTVAIGGINGTLTLAGTTSFNGPGGVSVQEGELHVTGLLSSTRVSVGSNASLGGSGTIAAPTTVAGSLWPENLTLTQLSLQPSSGCWMGIAGSGSTAGIAGVDYAHVQTTGSVGPDYGGGGLGLLFGNTTDFADGTTFDLFSFNGAPTGTLAGISALYSPSSTYRNAIFTSDGNGVWTSQQLANNQQLKFTEATGQLQVLAAVPEPATWALATVGAGFLGWMARRRRG